MMEFSLSNLFLFCVISPKYPTPSWKVEQSAQEHI